MHVNILQNQWIGDLLDISTCRWASILTNSYMSVNEWVDTWSHFYMRTSDLRYWRILIWLCATKLIYQSIYISVWENGYTDSVNEYIHWENITCTASWHTDSVWVHCNTDSVSDLIYWLCQWVDLHTGWVSWHTDCASELLYRLCSVSELTYWLCQWVDLYTGWVSWHTDCASELLYRLCERVDKLTDEGVWWGGVDGASVEELHDLFDKVAWYGGGVGQDIIPNHLHNLK